MKPIVQSKFYLLFWGFLLISMTSYAQIGGEIAKPEINIENPVILSHYTSEELSNIQISDSVKFATIYYYYTESFIVESISCSECVPFDASLFDVSFYERFRKKSERYTRVYEKYGFKLILLSIDELEYTLPIHNQ